MDKTQRILADLESPDWQVRRDAIDAVARIADPGLIPALVKAMAQPVDADDPYIDWEGLSESEESAIVTIGKAAIEPLRKLRDDGAQPENVHIVVEWLLSVVDERQFWIESQINNLEDDDPDLRRIAVMTLVGLTDELEVVPLLARAVYDENETVRLFAVAGLRQIGTPEALQALKDSGQE